MVANKINAETMKKVYDENGENIMAKKYSVGDTVLENICCVGTARMVWKT